MVDSTGQFFADLFWALWLAGGQVAGGYVPDDLIHMTWNWLV